MVSDVVCRLLVCMDGILSDTKIRDCHKKEVEMALQPLYKECIKEDLSKREGR